MFGIIRRIITFLKLDSRIVEDLVTVLMMAKNKDCWKKMMMIKLMMMIFWYFFYRCRPMRSLMAAAVRKRLRWGRWIKLRIGNRRNLVAFRLWVNDSLSCCCCLRLLVNAMIILDVRVCVCVCVCVCVFEHVSPLISCSECLLTVFCRWLSWRQTSVDPDRQYPCFIFHISFSVSFFLNCVFLLSYNLHS